MNLLSLLLRVLLCVSLVANGAGNAQASSRMQFEHAPHAATVHAPAPQARATGSPPCHSATVAEDAHAVGMSHSIAHGSPPSHAKSAQDCCKGKTCDCACTHASCAATLVCVTPPPALAQPGARVSVSSAARPQPRLPHLIRPPIG